MLAFTVQAQKIYHDSTGSESSRGNKKDLIEIGIFGEDVKNSKGMIQTNPLYLKKHWLVPGEQKLKFIVRKRPIKAGIDPYNKLTDRITGDNMKTFGDN